MREGKSTRQWSTIRFIEGRVGGKRIDEIARELQCSTRTVRRDIEMFQRSGYAIVSEKTARGTVWRFEMKTSLPPVPYTALEALALTIAAGTFDAAGDKFLSSLLQGLSLKLAQDRPQTFTRHVRQVEESVFVQARGTASSFVSQHYEVISQAIARKVKLSLDYCNASGRSGGARVIAPLRLWVSNRNTYLVAFCYQKQRIRTFRLSRLNNVSLTDEHFTDEWQFDLEKTAAESFGVLYGEPEEVELVFDPVLRQYVTECRVHPSQQVRYTKDRICLKMRVGLNEELVSWILGFGCLVFVKKPEALAKVVAERHQLASELYASPARGSGKAQAG